MEVAAEFARGREPAGHVDAFQALRQFRGQQRRLHALREAHFLFEPFLVRDHRLVETRVLDRHRRVVGEKRQQLDVTLVERVEFRAREVEDADAAILVEERDHQLRAHVFDHLDVARILAHVRHVDRHLVQRRVAGEAFAELQPRLLHGLAVVHGDLEFERLTSFR